MGKIKFLLIGSIFCFCVEADLAAAPVSIRVEEPPNWNSARLSEVVKLSVKDFQRITGKKMKLNEKIAFSVGKAKMKHWLKKHDDVSLTEYYRLAPEKKSLGWLWLSIGLILFLVIAFFIFMADEPMG